MQKDPRVLTGSRTTGAPHLGNYFGAFKPAIDLQDKYELFLFLADFHALNERFTRQEMNSQSWEMIATLLACGLDPKRSLLYAQSLVPEVNELVWILACQAPYGMLLRAHSFKDAQAKGLEVNMGLFNYPILMAADILLYDANLVPVGKDQKQHLEMTSDFAQRFNNRYGEVLVIPEPLISDDVGLVPGIDGEKMSKSKGNHVPIFATDKVWEERVKSIVTDAKGLNDPKDPDSCNVFALYKLLATPEECAEVATKYRAGGYGYGHAKMALLAKLKEVFGPKREKFNELMKRPDDLRDIVTTGSRKARDVAVKKLSKIYDALGLIGADRLK